MDQSFNDQELSDIMKEIEALEEDYSSTEDKPESAAVEVASPIEEKVSAPVETPKIVAIDSVRSVSKKTSTNSTSMSFKVQGNLTVDLQFDIGGKTVSLEVTEEGLSIVMDGGMKFTVPVGEQSSLKKAV